jgi:hypothetical protein
MGSRVTLGKRVVVLCVRFAWVRFQFHQLMTLVVMVGIAKVVVSTIRVTVVVTVAAPETVTVFVVVQAISMGVTKGSIVNVVIVDNVEGATMRLAGAMAVAVLESGSRTD